MKYKLNKNPDQVLEMAVDAVKYAKTLCPNVEFSAEDATRSDWDFLCRIFGEVVQAGATVINIPDTVGYAIPSEFIKLIQYIREHTPGIEKVQISVHCHNDLGLAVANSMAAVENGADQIECTINGLGERAGNAALEEIIMAIKTRADYIQAVTRINTEQIYRSSTLVTTLTGKPVQHNKAIVGANAFAHEAGIHQDGILKNRMTYEIMTPESIGLSQSQLVLGKHSGRHAVKNRLEEMGFTLSEAEVEQAYQRFIILADKKKEVTDTDLEALVRDHVFDMKDQYMLDYFHVSTGNTAIPTATVRLNKNGEEIQEASCGDGPIDAIYKTIDRITGFDVQLADYNIKAVTSGQDALGEVVVKVKQNGNAFVGRGVSTDIIEASTLAYLHAMNKVAKAING
jgi:2-isopropylmalate synthase